MYGGMHLPDVDEVDKMVGDLRSIKEYDKMKEYLEDHFGNFDGIKWQQYDELGKQVYMKIADDHVEFVALRQDRKYYSKGLRIKRN